MGFIPAIIVALLILLLKLDWRFGALLVAFGAGYFVVYVPTQRCSGFCARPLSRS